MERKTKERACQFCGGPKKDKVRAGYKGNEDIFIKRGGRGEAVEESLKTACVVEKREPHGKKNEEDGWLAKFGKGKGDALGRAEG